MVIRLGPIYNALDNGDNKGTIRLIRSAEMRHGPDPILFALKALALARSDRLSEAREACRGFLKCRPVEPAVLETALVAFKELGQLDWASEAYEAAVEQRPNDEALLTGLYFAYMREWSFLKQQQVATRLFRTFGAEKYLRWMALLIELQNGALTAPSLMVNGDDIVPVNSEFSRLLQLASMMLEKHSSPMDMSLPCLRQYVRVLRRLGRNDALVSTLQARKDLDPEFQFVLSSSLIAVENYSGAIAILQDLIENRNPDDWRYLSAFVDAHIASRNQFEDDGPVRFLRDLHSTNVRGPWLAELYATSQLGLDLHSQIVTYFQQFGNMKCFFSDVEPYLSKVSNIDKVLSEMEIPDGDMSDDQIRRRVSYEMCWRAFRLHCSCSDAALQAKAQNLFELFLGSVNPSKEKTEFGVGDDLCILCVVNLIDLYERSGRKSLLYQGVVVLTIGLQSSPHNFQFLLLLIRLYSELGAFLGAFEHYSALDTKSIQLETLTHLVQNDALRYGFVSHAVALASTVISHHEQYQRDAPDLAVLCYIKDNLDQALEFTQFRERMHRSFRLAESRYIAHFFNDFLNKNVTCSELWFDLPEEIDHKKLLVNDDFTLLVHPDKAFTPILNHSSSFLHEKSWLAQSNDSRSATLGFLRTSLLLTRALTTFNTLQLHEGLAELRLELSQIGVVDFSAPVTPKDSFAQNHWRFCVLVLESSISCCMDWEKMFGLLGGRENLDPKDLWFGFRRQISLLELSSQQLSHYVLDSLEDPKTSPAPLASYLYFSARWCTLFFQQYSNFIPLKRGSFDKHWKNSNNPDTDLEKALWKTICETSSLVGSFKRAFQAQLESLRDQLDSLQSRSDFALDVNEFFIKVARDDTEAVTSVKQLLKKSEDAAHDHARDSLSRCLKTLSSVKFPKP